MCVLFRSFASAVVLLIVAALNCAYLAFLTPETGSTASIILGACTISSALLAGGGVLAGIFLQRISNRREAAFRDTCTAMNRKAGEPMSSVFLETLHAREKQLARAKQKTPPELKRRFATDVLVCVLWGFAVNVAADHFLPGESEGTRRYAREVFCVLLGFLAVCLYGTYKLHLVNRIRGLKLIQIMIELRLANLSVEEVVQRKDLWVSQYLSRPLLQIIYE